MADELKHKTVGTSLDQSEYESITGHQLDSQAVGDTIRATSTTQLSRIKNNVSATAAPAVTDDSDAGYSVGSIWLDLTNDVVWIAIDVTVGAAVWLALAATTSPGAAPGGQLGGTWASQ